MVKFNSYILNDNKVYLEWSEIHELVNILCKKIITEYPNIDSVMGLPRGGLIPAVMISHELGLPIVGFTQVKIL